MLQKPFSSYFRYLIGILLIALLLAIGFLPSSLTQAASSIKVQIDKGGGTDNTQETTFNFLVKNTGTAAVSGLSVRIYFTPDGSNAASGYMLEKYYDQSGVATISAPTLLSGSTYYFTVNYGTASLAAGGQWEFQTALHLSSWGSTYSGANDYYHTGYAVGALPAAYTDTNNITAYVSGTLVWGTEPGGPTATFVPPTTLVPSVTSTASATATKSTPTVSPTGTIPATINSWQPDLIISAMQGGVNWCIGRVIINTTVKNQGTNSAGAFVVQIGNQAANFIETDTIPNGLAAGQSATITSYFTIPPQTSATYSAFADANNAVAESNENNNTQSVTVSLGGDCPTPTPRPTGFTPSPMPTSTSIPALPDLTITSLSQKIDPCNQSQLHLIAIVGNIGNANAGPFVLQLSETNSFSSGTILQQTVSGLTAGKSTTLDFYFPTTGVVTAFADSTFVIAEFDETNNTASTTAMVVGAPCLASPTYTPGGPTVTPTLTFTATNTPLPSATPTVNKTTSALPDLTVSSITGAPSTVPCGSGWNPGTNVTVANIGNANAASFVVSLNNGGSTVTQTVTSLAAGQSTTLRFGFNGGTFTATADSTNVIAESNESNNTATANFPVSDPIPCTATPTPAPTNATPVTPTKTNTPLPTSPGGADPCFNPTVITGSGTFSASTAGTCFKYVNTSFVNGGMFSIMKDGTSTSDTIKWYGGMDQNTTSCANQSSIVSGNGGQLNNFTVAKDANGQMFLIITGSGSNSVTISIQNWQNGAGCSVKPTVHP